MAAAFAPAAVGAAAATEAGTPGGDGDDALPESKTEPVQAVAKAVPGAGDEEEEEEEEEEDGDGADLLMGLGAASESADASGGGDGDADMGGVDSPNRGKKRRSTGRARVSILLQ